MARKKKRKSTMLPVLITFLVLSVITGIIVVIGVFSGNNNIKKDYVSAGNKESVEKENVAKNTDEEWAVRVNLDNCTLYVGTVLEVSATVTPTDGAVTWLSSNPEALIIDQNGKIVVAGTGIATITASVGAANDTVIIECLEEGGKAVLGFPVYSGIPEYNNAGETDTTNVTNPSDMSAAQTETTAAVQQTAQIRETERASEKSTEDKNVKPTEGVTKPVITATQPAQKPISEVDSSQMGTVLTQNGFTLHSDGTYVYEKDSVYYGEIIIDSDKTHIYILQNQQDFEQAAMQIIGKLIPVSYDSVWKTALKAQSDMSMNVDGRTVRIVVPQAGGHKQIVIYN